MSDALDEDAALMEWVGQHLYLLGRDVARWRESGEISEEIEQRILNSLSTVAMKLANRLEGR